MNKITSTSASFHKLRIIKSPIFLSKSLFSSSSSLQTIPDSPNSITPTNPLYNFLPDTQNPNKLVNLITTSLKHQTLTTQHQSTINSIIPRLGNSEISRVLLRCQSDSDSALTFFNWVRNDLGITPNAHNYCVLVHILTWSKQFKHAMKFLTELILFVKDGRFPGEDVFRCLVLNCKDCNWDPVVFDMVIKAYVKVGLVKKALGACLSSVELGYVPSVVACNCLLNGLLKMNWNGDCWRVYELMGRVGICANSCTFNIMTRVFCEGGDIGRVNDFLEKMEEEGFEPDIVTYNTLISSYCRRGRLNDAFYLYKIMFKRNMFPDLVTYTALMNGLCKEGKVRDAHQLLRRMVDRGLSPDVVCYNTLISGYCKEKNMKQSKALLYEMIGNSICPDDFTCRVLVRGYQNEGKLALALNLIVDLEKFGVPIPHDIYDDLIVFACEENQPFAAKTLLERIVQHGYVPTLEIYNELIKSLCKSDHISEALLLKSEMVDRSLTPNVVSYKAIVCCLCRMNRVVEAEWLMEEMIQSGVKPDAEICRAMIRGYCNKKDVTKAELLLRFFAEGFQVFDTESHNALVRIFSEEGNVDELMELQNRLLKVGLVPNSLACRYTIQGLWKAKELERSKLLAAS